MPREGKGRGRPPGDLSPSEWADLFERLHSTGLSIPQVAVQTRKSRKTVANLLRVKRKLDPKLFKLFAAREMKQDEAVRLAAFDDQDEQWEAWGRLRGGGRPTRSPKEIVDMRRSLLMADDGDEDVTRAAIQALDWVLDRRIELLGRRLPTGRSRR